MGNVPFIDIVILAMIAAFLIFRLRSVLGRRTGHERQRQNPFTERNRADDVAGPGERGGERGPDNVVTLPSRDRDGAGSGDDEPEEQPGPARQSATAADAERGLAQIRSADPSFDPRGFLQGAQAAFGMIVEAYANGDTGTLRPLLSDDLYDAFAGAIRERLTRGETLETRIKSIERADIEEARMEGRTAFVVVRFVTDQVNVTRDKDGAVIDGDPDESAEVVDLWTLARNTRATDPNWVLVETATPA